MRNGNTSTMEKALFGKCITESKKLSQILKTVLFIEVNSSSSTPHIETNC